MKLEFISAPELAGRIIRGDRDLGLFDLRTGRLRAVPHSTARRATANDLADATLPPQMNVVLYADARATLFDALRVLRGRNHRDARVLREGISEWLGRVQEPSPLPFYLAHTSDLKLTAPGVPDGSTLGIVQEPVTAVNVPPSAV
jgi:hypothetical protein